MGEFEFGKERLDDGFNVGAGRDEEASGEDEGLGDGKERQAGITLGDIGRELAKGRWVDRGRVQEKGVESWGGSSNKDVEDGLFGTAEADKGEDLRQ